MQRHYYRVWQVDPFQRLGEVTRSFSWAIEHLALCLNNNNNNNNEQLEMGDWNSLKVNLEIMDQRPG